MLWLSSHTGGASPTYSATKTTFHNTSSWLTLEDISIEQSIEFSKKNIFFVSKMEPAETFGLKTGNQQTWQHFHAHREEILMHKIPKSIVNKYQLLVAPEKFQAFLTLVSLLMKSDACTVLLKSDANTSKILSQDIFKKRQFTHV